jgi:alpha-glucosidase
VRVDGDLLVIERGDTTVLLNCGTTDVALPAGRVLISSGSVDRAGGVLPPDTAAWVRRPARSR